MTSVPIHCNKVHSCRLYWATKSCVRHNVSILLAALRPGSSRLRKKGICHAEAQRSADLYLKTLL